jgi:hypothetical protein
MSRLSKEARDRIDKAVELAATRLSNDHQWLKDLFFGRPNKFSLLVHKIILFNWELKNLLEPEEFVLLTPVERIELIDASIRRLRRAKKLEKRLVDVSVMQKRNSRVVTRQMACYFPVSILDEMARC